jgi:methionine synthase II (cobalamin-independent)
MLENKKRPDFVPCGMATGIGSLPHKDPSEAVGVLLERLGDAPFWPQLPMLGPQEGMTLQYTPGLPGLEEGDDSATIDTGERGQSELAEFYERALSNQLDTFALASERAVGFSAFVEELEKRGGVDSVFLKGHITGPVTLTSALKDKSGRDITYDETFREAVSTQLAKNALWQIRELEKFGKPVIIFLDEPVVEVFGSAYSSLSLETMTEMWTPSLEAISGAGALSGIHCCGNTDWGVLMRSGTDMVSFDAYHFLDKMVLYADDATKFMEAGGALAWGIVPTSEEARGETPESLMARIEEGVKRFEEAGVDGDLLRRQCVITPSCGMGSLSVELTEYILELLAGTSKLYRERFGF